MSILNPQVQAKLVKNASLHNPILHDVHILSDGCLSLFILLYVRLIAVLFSLPHKLRHKNNKYVKSYEVMHCKIEYKLQII